MKITNKKRHVGINVSNIEGGEIFSQDGEYYLKLAAGCCGYEVLNLMRKKRMIDDLTANLDTVESREDIEDTVANYTNSYNAVNLETGELTYASGTALLVDGELVVNSLK